MRRTDRIHVRAEYRRIECLRSGGQTRFGRFAAKPCGSDAGPALAGDVERPLNLGDVLRVGLPDARRLLVTVVERGIGDGGGLSLARRGGRYRFACRTDGGIEADGGGADIRERATILGPECRGDDTDQEECGGMQMPAPKTRRDHGNEG